MVRGFWRRRLSPRSGAAHGAAGFGSRDDQFSWRRDLSAQRCAARLEEHGEEILGVYALPEAHRKRMRTTNMLKRRTRVIRLFPHEQSCLRLVTALLMETNQEWMERMYMRMEEEPVSATETPAVARQPTRTRTRTRTTPLRA